MHATDSKWRARQLILLPILLVCLVLHPEKLLAASGNGVEVKALGLLDVDASFEARYLLDDQERSSTSTITSSERRSAWEEEFFLLTKSYVYHPGFLNMEIGGGPLFVQEQYDSGVMSASNNETLFNFLARLNFLDIKWYPLSVYYQRSHPSYATSLSGRFLTEKNQYGLQGFLTPLEKRLRVKIDLSHEDTEGSNFGTVIDEDVDQGSVSVSGTYRKRDRFNLKHSQSSRKSSSGSAGLPIRLAIIHLDTTNLQLNNYFGADQRVRLAQSVVKVKQRTESAANLEINQLSYSASGLIRHSDSVRSTLAYRLNESRRTVLDSQTQAVSASVDHSIKDKFWYAVGLDHEVSQQTGFERDLTALGGRFSYSRPTAFGSVGLSASVRQSRTDQESSVETARIFDEPVTLNGTTPVDLANEFVAAETVVVHNAARTQVFIEDIDYRLITIGSVTSIQRLISGNIFDGQAVLINYEYETSGTVEFESFDSNLGASIGFLNYARAQFRYRLRDTNVISGELTTPINDQQVVELSLGADIPLKGEWKLGGDIRYTDQDEDISSWTSESVSIYASRRLPRSMHLHISAGLFRVDQENSMEDTDQVNLGLRLSGQLWRRTQLNFNSEYLRDTGGSMRREQLRNSFDFRWQYRKVNLLLRARLTEDTLGVTKRRHQEFVAQVERVF